MSNIKMLGINFVVPQGPSEESNFIIEQLNQKEYLKIFEHLLNLINTTNGCSLEEKVKNYQQSCLNSWKNSEQYLETLAVGLGPFFLFIQNNWLGPKVSLGETNLKLINDEFKNKILKDLVLDGENIVPAIEFLELLYFSKIILEGLYNYYTKSLDVKMWFLRCLFIQQQILEELSPVLFDKLNNIINEILEEFDSLSQFTKIAFYLEFGRIFLFYGNIQKSKENIKKATDLSGINISLSGALGKRTKFQQKNLAQLIVNINLKSLENYFEEDQKTEICTLPIDLKLNDEVRLDKIKFIDEFSRPELSGIQQAVVLGNLFMTEKSQPKDNLANEELQPLIQYILDQPKVWAIRTTVLLLRSKFEASHKRTVERSMMQLQVLADGFEDRNVSLEQKSLYFFISHLPPKWETRWRLANTLVSMGSLKSALDIYLGLEDWENVIFCYNNLQMRHKAEEIIEQELKKNPSPKLWCLLGDATDDISCYEKAWDLSKKKSARAQRHWALFYYHRRNYKESIDHFQKSLEINSLQSDLWYRLGYAALMVENWKISASAYRRYVILDPDCFEAWNNLGRCYCEMKETQRAWKAFQEALKVDYSNWKVWENYMVVSADLKMFDDVIKSYHEILNLKGKHLDKSILNSLVIQFKNFSPEENDNKNNDFRNKFKSKLMELFGRISSHIFNDYELWFLYSEVVETDSLENLMKKHGLLVKSHRSAINKTGWEKNLENCNKIIYILSKLVEVSLLIKKPDILMSCKLAAAGTITKIKMEYSDVDICKNLETNLEEVERILATC